MKLPPWMPRWPELTRETLTVIGGAVLAAVIISQVPSVKRFIKDAWN